MAQQAKIYDESHLLDCSFRKDSRKENESCGSKILNAAHRGMKARKSLASRGGGLASKDAKEVFVRDSSYDSRRVVLQAHIVEPYLPIDMAQEDDESHGLYTA